MRIFQQLLLCSLTSLACSVDLDRQDSPCRSPSHCPPGYTCDLARQTCVAEDTPGDVTKRPPFDSSVEDGSTAAPDVTVTPPPDVSLPPDVSPPDVVEPPTCTPGLCKACDDNDTPYMPADDPACGAIDCDGKDNFVIDGAASASGTNYRVKNDYHDLIAKRCKALGQCKAPNSADCVDVTSSRVNTCGKCEKATTSGCETYGDYTSCGGEARCYDGYCVTACPTHDDGTQPCSVLCGWCKGVCRGARTDAGQNVSCSHKGEPMWCYCSF